MKRAIAATTTLLVSGLGAVHAGPASASVALPTAVTRTAAGNYLPAAPTRLVDTRIGQGAPIGSVDTGESVTVRAAAVAGIPATGVRAIVVNLTAVKAHSRGWFTAFPSGTSLPATSTLNFRAGWTGSVTATVPVGADGTIIVRAGAGGADLLVDVVGWYAGTGSTQTGGTLLSPQDPYRLDDTRYNKGALSSGSTRVEEFGFYDSAGSRLKAVVANITAVAGSTSSGYLTTWSGTGTRPATSTLQYARNEVSPNTTNVPVTYRGVDALGNSRYSFGITAIGAGSVDVVVDIAGFYTTAADGVGSVFVPVTPTRLVDSRFGLGTTKAARGTNSTTNLLVPGHLVNTRTQAFVGNLTGTRATTGTHLTMWSGTAPTDSSTTNVAPNRERANGAVVVTPRNDDNARLRYSVYNRYASCDFIVDMTGRFDTSPDQPAGAFSSKRIVSHKSYPMPTR